MRGKELSVPLSNAMYGKLSSMILQEQQGCNRIADDYIKQANETGAAFR